MITKEISELSYLDMRVSFVLAAFALFHVAIIVGAMLAFSYIEKYTSNQRENVMAFIMAFSAIMGATFLFISIITISWTIVALVSGIIAMFLCDCRFKLPPFINCIIVLAVMILVAIVAHSLEHP